MTAVSGPRRYASAPFAARFDGECAGCGFEVNEGEQIVMLDGQPVHDDDECLERA